MAARIFAIISRYVWKLRSAFRCGNRPGYGCDHLDVIGSIVKPMDVEHYCAQLVKGFVAWGLSYMVEDELVGVGS